MFNELFQPHLVFVLFIYDLFKMMSVALTTQHLMAQLMTNTERRLWKQTVMSSKHQSGYVTSMFVPRTIHIWSRCRNYSTAILILPTKCPKLLWCNMTIQAVHESKQTAGGSPSTWKVNKTDSVHTQHWGTFKQLLLQRKSNMYYIFWVCLKA